MDEILGLLPTKISSALTHLSQEIKESAEEIRLREGKQICIMRQNKPIFIGPILTQYDISATVKLLCNNSVYAHTNELNNGYISLKNGHRAGVTGNFLGGNLYEFSSINIRIARQILGAANFLNDKDLSGGLLLAGPPGCGKTTVLRDLVRQLSLNNFRVCVVDTRGEISAFSGGVIHNDLGPNTDVLFGISKEKGIEIALRTFSPNFIAFDEIGTTAELEKVFDSINSGAAILTTAHIGKKEELLLRPITNKLILSRAVNTVGLFGDDKKVLDCKELIDCNT